MKKNILAILALILALAGCMSGPAVAGSPVPGKTLVWDGTNFSDTTRWGFGRSSAYPGLGPTNRGDNKLDWISPYNRPSAYGTFDARRRADGYWNTDLATTEFVPGGFEFRPGDTLIATVTLYNNRGTWPALWTWGRDLSTGVQPGHGEVDFFEYHGDNPRLLELSNHTRGTYRYADNVITPGTPFTLRVDMGLASVSYYVNGRLIWADGRGVPSNWRAWPVVNISISAGMWHPSPWPSVNWMRFNVSQYRVYR